MRPPVFRTVCLIGLSFSMGVAARAADQPRADVNTQFVLKALADAGIGEAPSADNTPPEGFELLFNGKDLTGWKGLVDNPPRRTLMTPEELSTAQKAADEKAHAHWSVQDGALVYDGQGDSLCSSKDYANFELFVDWKIGPKGDSGIYLRGSPQVQIWDPSLPVAGGVGSGGLYNNKDNPSKPTAVADKPIGEWNTFHVKMVGEKVWVTLNGQLVVDNVTMENYWERDKPIYPTGQIELQHHNHTIYFKNIYIKELPQ